MTRERPSPADGRDSGLPSSPGGASAASPRRPGESEREFADRQKLESRLGRIRRRIVVLSGKGGVGKSTVAVNLAAALARAGEKTGLLDVDIHGPSIPTMLGLEGAIPAADGKEFVPVEAEGIRVMSLGFLLASPDDAVIWRGPLKMGVIRQFLSDVAWGELDFLVVDSPPGTGDEPLSLCQLLGRVDGAVIVTTPQKVAAVDVRKCVTFCRKLAVPVLGVVENMAAFACPKCGEITPIFSAGGGRALAEGMGVPFLGSIPIDPLIAESGDRGLPFIRHYAGTPTARIMEEIIRPILALDPKESAAVTVGAAARPERIEGSPPRQRNQRRMPTMRIAIPITGGALSAHFGHCETFALIDVDPEAKKIVRRTDLEPPPHEPGLLPAWLKEKGAELIIAGGMGQRAQDLFAENGIQVLVGAPSEKPGKLAADYLNGTLRTGENVCDH